MSSQAFDPLASSAPLIVYIDYKSPYAYLAIAPTCAMADELGIAIDWRPFTLDIPSYLGSARLNKEGKVVEENRAPGQWLRVKYAYRDVRRYGAAGSSCEEPRRFGIRRLPASGCYGPRRRAMRCSAHTPAS